MPTEVTNWWGDVALNSDHVACCKVGPLTLTIKLIGSEWHVATQRNPDDPELADAELSVASDDPLVDCVFQRLIFSDPMPQAYLSPALADRAVVSRPAQPLLLAPGQQATLFVHAPLWLQVRPQATGHPLLDLSIVELSDTWFGASSREGELCYANRTKARIKLDTIPLRPHRAITPVRIHNQGSDPLKLDKINLPQPYLTLFRADNGLWTDAVELVRNSAGDMTPVHISNGVPPEALNGEAICAPRKVTERGGFLSSFTALFN